MAHGSHAVTVLFVILMTIPYLAVGCGGSTPTAASPPPGSGGPNPDLTITITSAGVNPHSITVSPGWQVTFVNNDSASHQMFSDPHPDHTDCPEINQVGFLGPRQSRQTGNLNTARTCGFHDHGRPGDDSLKGSIVIR